MVSTLSRNRVREDLPVSFANQRSQRVSTTSAARVALVDSASLKSAMGSYPVAFANASSQPVLDGSAVRQPMQAPARPHLVPVEAPARKTRKAPLLVRANRALQASLIALCGIAILGYGYDVASTHDVGKQQDQVRRINEQNAELSANMLKQVSYAGIQNSVHGHVALVVPEDVKIVAEVAAPKLKTFKPAKYHLPLLSGY
ncbi:MAG: hypothetical protein JSS86_17310 [Cyanobacteria bacterium SZAS LIN-2]|nr:hypothetical protein [Cyanobacteria bacterium SZAS LIN-3]MBS1998087.1 hypothetical protein [Cyanobacteria bacterium SZAS LIN-2]MBS2008838.1 hypothetical protein [Cyanobacteria bacterium SZAS TMP-1]